MKEPIYLGDGVYITDTGNGSFMLTTGHHLEELADHVIYLESDAIPTLLRYLHKE